MQTECFVSICTDVKCEKVWARPCMLVDKCEACGSECMKVTAMPVSARVNMSKHTYADIDSYSLN